MTNIPYTNTGCGHVWPRPDGLVNRCGGPVMCDDCRADAELIVDFLRIPATNMASEKLAIILRVLEHDPHLFRSRPCPTCQTVSTLAGKDWGCVARRKMPPAGEEQG